MKKTEEYLSLRDEILGLINIQNNYIIAMYTIAVTILVFGIQCKNEWVLLLPYVIIISFQRIISAKNDGMIRIAAYISVYLENDIGWESYYKKIIERTTIKNSNSQKFSQIRRISSLQLGLLCSICSSIFCVNNNLEIWKQNVSMFQYLKTTLPILIAILLYCILSLQCSKVLKSMEKREVYIQQLKLLKNENIKK